MRERYRANSGIEADPKKVAHDGILMLGLIQLPCGNLIESIGPAFLHGITAGGPK
jgi:hypothetical protein